MSKDGTELISQFDDTKQKGGRKAGQLGPKKEAEISGREAKSILFAGITMSEAEVIFKMDRRTIQTRAGEVRPSGKRNGTDIYLIRDLAPFLVKPAGDMGDFIKRANPRDLPPLLQKEYWNGQRARNAFLLEEGSLWRTEAVVATLADAFKAVRTLLLVLPDQLALKANLTDRQREDVSEYTDQTMDAIRRLLVEQFGGDPTHEDRPGSFTESVEPDYDDTFDDPAEAASEVDEEEYDDTFD